MIKRILVPTFFLFFAHQAFSQTAAELAGLKPQAIQQEEVSSEGQQAQLDAESQLLEQEQLAKAAQSESDKTDSLVEKSLAEFLVVIQKYRVDLSEIKLVRVRKLDADILKMKERSESLASIEKKILNSRNTLTTADLNLATVIWRHIVDLNLSSLFETDSVQIPPPPRLPDGLSLSGKEYQELKFKITQALSETETERIQLKEDLQKLSISERGIRSGLLLNAGRIRAELMDTLIHKNAFSAWSLGTNEIQDYLREFKIVPYRFIATFTQKYFEFNTLSQEGVQGWTEIIKQLFLLLLVLGIPFFVLRLFHSFSAYLEKTRKQIFTPLTAQLQKSNTCRALDWSNQPLPALGFCFHSHSNYLDNIERHFSCPSVLGFTLYQSLCGLSYFPGGTQFYFSSHPLI